MVEAEAKMIRRCNKIHVTKDLQETTATPSRGFLDKRRRCEF